MRKRAQVTKIKIFRPHYYSHQPQSPVVTAFNLFILQDGLTGTPRVIQKCSKGCWINKEPWAFIRVVWREDCVYFSWLSSWFTAALTELVEPEHSHSDSSAFYTTYVPALGLFVFLRHRNFIPLSLSARGFCSCKSEAMNYGTFSTYGVSYKI